MKISNPLRNYLTPSEQKMLLFIAAILLMGNILDIVGWNPLQAEKADADSLYQVVQTDAKLNLDIRSASLQELMSLSGIGEKRAKDIIAYRIKQQFRSVNELLNIKGIGAKTYAKLLPDLLVFGDSSNTELKSVTSTKKDKAANAKTPAKGKAELSNVVNINTASVKELCTLVGIGEVKAKAIVDWRSENGKFSSVEDFVKVPGIGAKTLEKNMHRLTVGD